MSDTNYEPYATKEDLQTVRVDMLERFVSVEGRLGRIEGQLSNMIRLNYFIAASLLAMAIKVLFFPT